MAAHLPLSGTRLTGKGGMMSGALEEVRDYRTWGKISNWRFPFPGDVYQERLGGLVQCCFAAHKRPSQTSPCKQKPKLQLPGTFVSAASGCTTRELHLGIRIRASHWPSPTARRRLCGVALPAVPRGACMLRARCGSARSVLFARAQCIADFRIQIRAPERARFCEMRLGVYSS